MYTKEWISGCVSEITCLKEFIGTTQNSRQRVFNGGLCICSGGLYILNFDKNSTDLYCFIIQFGGAWTFVWGAKSPKAPSWRRDWYNHAVGLWMVAIDHDP